MKKIILFLFAALLLATKLSAGSVTIQQWLYRLPADNKLYLDTNKYLVADATNYCINLSTRVNVPSVSVSGYDIAEQFDLVATDTTTLRTDLNAVKVDTGTIGTDITNLESQDLAIGVTTGTLYTKLVGVSTWTLAIENDLAAVKLDTGTLSDTISDLAFDVQMDTSALKSYIDNNFNKKIAFETVTDSSTLTISSNCIVICDIAEVTTGTWTLMLPIATLATEVGKVFEIKNMGDSDQFISIDAGAKTIDGGASTYCLDPLNTVLRIALKSDYNWVILGKYTP